MSIDMDQQVRAYAEFLDSTLPVLDAEDAMVERLGDVPVRLLRERTLKPAVPGWVWAAGAAAVTIIVGILAVVLLRLADEQADVIQPAPPSLIGPGAWDLAVTLPPDFFLVENVPYASIGDIVTALESIDGVVEVAEVQGLRDDWTDLIGAEGRDIGCSPQCEQGVVVVAETMEDLEETARVFFGFDWRVPSSEINLSPSASTGLAELGAARVKYLTSYIETVAGQTSPEPMFDTDALGTEQVLVAIDASEVPPPGHPEPVEPFRPQALVVEITGTGVGAFLQYPEPTTLESTDAIEFDLAPGGLSPDDLRFELVGFCGCEVPASGELGGGGTSIPLFSLDPTEGLMSHELRSDIYWRIFSESGFGFGIGGLPSTVAVVATELPDGTRLWQRPVSGIAFFTANGSFEFLFAEAGGAPSLVGYDASGVQIFPQR